MPLYLLSGASAEINFSTHCYYFLRDSVAIAIAIAIAAQRADLFGCRQPSSGGETRTFRHLFEGRTGLTNSE